MTLDEFRRSTGIDLQRYCLRDPETSREYLLRPLSAGRYTYATNGHLMVRVDRIDDIPRAQVMEPEGTIKAFSIDAPLEGHAGADNNSFRSVAHWRFPDRAVSAEASCKGCGGKGWYRQEEWSEHETCLQCDGTGQSDSDLQCVSRIGESWFALRYLRMLHELPGCEFAPDPVVGKPIFYKPPSLFRFKGGIGALMSMRFDGDNTGRYQKVYL